jgi:hypothetical protein
MRGISIKAFLAGNILSILLSLVFAVVISTLGLIQLKHTGASNPVKEHMLRASYTFGFAVTAAISLGFVISGYVSARLSESRFFLNAGLASTLGTLINIHDAVMGKQNGGVLDGPTLLALSWAAPLFAVLGGYLRVKQLERQAAR